MSYPPGPNLFIRWHLGLGDALLCNGLVRHFAQRQVVIIPCKKHNLASIQFQFRDNPNIHVLPVKDDAEADALCQKHDWALKLGMFGAGFNVEKWDESFYAQANLPFEKRWTEFYFRREPSSEIQPPHKGEYAFIHEDSERGMGIDDAKLPGIPLIIAEPQPTIFSYTRVIEEAAEIHCIGSCFSILADSIPTRARRLVLHQYARQGKDVGPPHYWKNWEILS